MDVVILGLSISSSWGNGHATIYRALAREFLRRGHRFLFLERDVEWYARHRDIPDDLQNVVRFYHSCEELESTWKSRVAAADLVVVGSFTPEGATVGRWVMGVAEGARAFYDIDTPLTLAKLEAGDCDYLAPQLIPDYDVYLSFTGGPILDTLETQWGAQRAQAFYCTADPLRYRPMDEPCDLDLGYLGAYSDDRQSVLDGLLLQAARDWPEGRFAVIGAQFPDSISWPSNVYRLDHLGPSEHCRFYNRQRFTLNVTRENMVRAGYSPSVRLFEAAACGTPIISDWWQGLDRIFEPETEILIASSGDDTLRYLRDVSDSRRLAMGRRLRQKLVREHAPACRVDQLEELVRSFANRLASVAG